MRSWGRGLGSGLLASLLHLDAPWRLCAHIRLGSAPPSPSLLHQLKGIEGSDGTVRGRVNPEGM